MDNREIVNGFKVKIGRHKTTFTTCENMVLYSTKPIKEDKPREAKPSIPSDYANYNYYNRNKQRRRKVREMCFNSFKPPEVTMLSLTFDPAKFPENSLTDIEFTNREFKKFIQRVNSHYENFKYISTYSRQSNGNWHYHLMCNFTSAITNEEVTKLWKNGLTYVTYLKDQDTFQSAIDYLIANLNESTDDKKGKHGYLKSDNMEQDIVIKSWRAEDKEIFDSVYEKIMESSAKEMYETSNNIGVQGEQVNSDTGEIFPIHLPDLKLTDTMKMAGFTSWDSVYTYFSSSARFEDKFKELVPATLRKKKFKRS